MGAAWMSRGILISQSDRLQGWAGTHPKRIQRTNTSRIQGALERATLRIRSDEFDGLIAHLLFAVGNTATPDQLPTVSLSLKYMKDDKNFPLYMDVHQEWITFLGQALDAMSVRTDKMIDPSPFLDSVEKKHGMAGGIIAQDIMKAMNQQLHISPYALIRNVEWSDITELEGLFKSQSLETQYGTFFDQRFIDFLGQNFERIDDIHWRKFEALTCEFFERHGYYVEIGPGTNDDGVDARAWQSDPANGGPPTILIQCKRRRDKVEKTS